MNESQPRTKEDMITVECAIKIVLFPPILSPAKSRSYVDEGNSARCLHCFWQSLPRPLNEDQVRQAVEEMLSLTILPGFRTPPRQARM